MIFVLLSVVNVVEILTRHARVQVVINAVTEDNHGPAIIGGTPVGVDAFPWLVYIFRNEGHTSSRCAGTVVAPSLVLTAGHCAMNLKTDVPYQPAGYGVITANGRGASRFKIAKVSRVIVYPGFSEASFGHDVALLVLATPTSAPAISLPAEGVGPPSPSRQAVIVGWGLIEGPEKRALSKFRALRASLGPNSNILSWVIRDGQHVFVFTKLRANTVVQAPKWCQNNNYTFYAQSDLCTIDPPRYKTSNCGGSSGGPLLGLGASGDPPVELGVASRGDNRAGGHRSVGCSGRRPGIFTRTDAISLWIRTWIAVYSVVKNKDNFIPIA